MNAKSFIKLDSAQCMCAFSFFLHLCDWSIGCYNLRVLIQIKLLTHRQVWRSHESFWWIALPRRWFEDLLGHSTRIETRGQARATKRTIHSCHSRQLNRSHGMNKLGGEAADVEASSTPPWIQSRIHATALDAYILPHLCDSSYVTIHVFWSLGWLFHLCPSPPDLTKDRDLRLKPTIIPRRQVFGSTTRFGKGGRYGPHT